MGGLLEHLRESEHYRPLEMLANWDHLVAPDNIEETFKETLRFFYKKFVNQEIERLQAKDCQFSLTLEEKQALITLLSMKN